MSLSSLLAGIAMLALSGGVIAAPLIACPASHIDGKHARQLNNASVFDGPPEKLVDLMPDLETFVWDLAMVQEDAQERGESMYLVCRYKGTESTVTLKIPRDATYCKVYEIKKSTYAYCGSPLTDAHATPH